MFDVLNYTIGYLQIKIVGLFPERFLNVCVKKNITLWGIKKKEDIIIAKISRRDFKKIRKIARGTRNKVKILKKIGVSFEIKKYKKRHLVIFGFIASILILIYTSTHVTGIVIEGNKKLKNETILNEIKKLGLKRGVRIKKLNPREIENKMMTRMYEIAWIGIDCDASKVVISIKERKDEPNKIDEKNPCDLIASKNGVIELLEIKEGQKKTNVGKAVKKGDLLVSGVLEHSNSKTKLVHSLGNVYAKTWYSKSEAIPFFYNDKIKTKKTKIKYELIIENKTVKLYLDKKIPFKDYEFTEKKEQIKILGQKNSDLYLLKRTYEEIITEEKQRNIEETLEYGKNKLKTEIEGELADKTRIENILCNYCFIDKENQKMSDADGAYAINLEIEYECSENIATEAPINFENQGEN